MASVFFTLLKATWVIARVIIIPIAIVLALIGAAVVVQMVVAYADGSRRPKGDHIHVRRPNFLRSFFWDFPRQYVIDYFSRNPEYFRHQGCVIFTGRQGSGKTVALVEQTLMMQKEYPKCKVISNLNYKYQDEELTDWHQLITYKNDIQGVIVQMDELQNWFSSNQSKNFPPEMLEVITQNRKNRRIILGTSQVFTRLSKPLREQATEVRKCLTIAGCLTIVHRVEPVLKSDGDVEKWKHRGFYWFVHTPKIREAYDTYHVIESLQAAGFQEAAPNTTVDISIVQALQQKRLRK